MCRRTCPLYNSNGFTGEGGSIRKQQPAPKTATLIYFNELLYPPGLLDDSRW